MKSKIRFIVLSGVIAATYAALTYISAAMGLAYGQVQFRLSEAMCVLAAFTPAAIPGLTVGCLLANLGSTLGPVDMLCGTAATLVAAVIGCLVRNVRVFKVPLLTPLACVISNALIVGAELALILTPNEAFLPCFAINALWVAVGEVVMCFGVGIPLWLVIDRTPAIKRLFNEI